MRDTDNRSDPTVDWMTADIAERCREALQRLESCQGPTTHLAEAAMVLRSAADDLVSLVELVEGPDAAARVRTDGPSAFDLAFRNASEQAKRG